MSKCVKYGSRISQGWFPTTLRHFWVIWGKKGFCHKNKTDKQNSVLSTKYSILNTQFSVLTRIVEGP